MNSGSTQPVTDREHEELRLLYSASVGEISFFKQQQWTVTNYAVALYVGLIVIAKQLLTKPVTSWKVCVLSATVVAVALAGIAVVKLLQSSIEVRRNRLSAIRSRFSAAFVAAWTQQKEVDDIHFLLHAVIVIAGVFSFWLLVAES
jgi:hypothetical protein